MTKKALAAKLGISPPYLSFIYHGRTRISQSKYHDKSWMEKTRRTYNWWQTAKLADMQKLFNRMLKA